MHIFLCFEQKCSSIIVGFYLERVFQFLIIFTSDSDNRKRDLFVPLEQYETPDKLLFFASTRSNSVLICFILAG